MTPYLLRYGRIISHNGRSDLDEVMAAFMPGPRSFTGEDMVEIYCHAGQIGLNTILNNILEFDCRPAEAGEFSMRRFLNHGVDLTRLEGAADIVTSKTDLAYRLSREHLLGAYGDHISNIRTKIVNLLAEIEADIDFPEEEDTGRIGSMLLYKQLGGIVSDLEHLSDLYKTGRIIKDGYRVVILGPTNAGKSSLFNRLVRQNRALVTPVPGTTRDYLSEWIDIDGLPVELYDTAGLRQARGRVEKAGIDKTAKLIGRADLLLVVYDLSRTPKVIPPIKLRRDQKLLILFNKVDLVKNPTHKIESWKKKASIPNDDFLISAKTGRGISKLLREIYNLSGLTDLTDSLVVTSHRHYIKINLCLKHLKKVASLSKMPPDIVSFELRQAADRIGEITGNIYTEQILDEIFSRFCIGK